MQHIKSDTISFFFLRILSVYEYIKVLSHKYLKTFLEPVLVVAASFRKLYISNVQKKTISYKKIIR